MSRFTRMARLLLCTALLSAVAVVATSAPASAEWNASCGDGSFQDLPTTVGPIPVPMYDPINGLRELSVTVELGGYADNPGYTGGWVCVRLTVVDPDGPLDLSQAVSVGSGLYFPYDGWADADALGVFEHFLVCPLTGCVQVLAAVGLEVSSESVQVCYVAGLYPPAKDCIPVL